MAESTGVILAAGTIVALNEVVFAPLADNAKINFNWRIIPATAIAAAALAGLEKLSPRFAVGLAWIALVTVLLGPVGNAPAPVENAAKVLGYSTGKAKK